MLNLPKKTEDGVPYISYSQYTSWKEAKSFNLGTKGMWEYMLHYFLGVDFGDKGWAEFGSDIEDYICLREKADKFTDTEKATLEKIKTLGVFQKEFKLNFGDFVMIGFIDDALPTLKKIRDYKSCSLSSSKKYYKDDYYQLDVYAMAIEQETGVVPELEVCMIERKGNCMFKGGREVLTVGTEIWYHTRQTSQERMDYLRDDIRKVAEEISAYYTAYQILIGNGEGR